MLEDYNLTSSICLPRLCNLDYEHDSVYVDPKVAKIILKDMKTIYPGARHFKEANGRLEEIIIKPG